MLALLILVSFILRVSHSYYYKLQIFQICPNHLLHVVIVVPALFTALISTVVTEKGMLSLDASGLVSFISDRRQSCR